MTRRVNPAWLIIPMLLLCAAAAFAAAPEEPVQAPVAVAGAMQEKQFARAIAALDDALPKATGEQREYLTYLKGLAQHYAGDNAAAVSTLAPFRDTWAGSLWAAKARFRMAAAYLAAKDYAHAAEIYEKDASHLVSPQRQDAIADLYLRLADELLHPEDKDTKPDYQKAHDLAAEALDLALSPDGRSRVLAQMGRILQAGQQWNNAVQDYDRYLKEAPGPERFRVRFWRGECLLATGNQQGAHIMWQDLGRDLPEAVKSAPADRKADLEALKATVAYAMPKAYGIPSPGDDQALSLGVEALRSALSEFPANEQAVQATYDIGAAYMHRNRDEEAARAFQAFLAGEGYQAKTDKAKEALRTLTMRATYQLGLIYQRQKKYDFALQTWQTYAKKYPDGPDWQGSQQASIGIEFQIGSDLLAEKRYPEARAALERFLAQHPLDSRAPQAMFGVGQALTAEKKFTEAIEAWRRLVSKFPKTDPASNAQYAIAETYAAKLKDPETALKEFEKCTWGPQVGPAREAIARMQAKHLEVITERVFRTNEAATIHVNVRNLKALTLRAYRLDLAAYFRSKQRITGVEALDINLVNPTKSWDVNVEGYGDYLQIAQDLPMPFEEPGVYAVTVTDGENLEATTLLIRSDLEIIVKSSRSETFVFAQNMRTNAGWPGAAVLVSDGGKVFFEGEAGPDGVFRKQLDELKSAGAVSVFATSGGHCAGNLLDLAGLRPSEALAAKGYLYTDRPAYRPGQTVQVRGIVRELTDGRYGFAPEATYQFEVTDARGRVLLSRPVTLGEFGAFAEAFTLDEQAPAGAYRLRVYQHGKSSFTGEFRVHAYSLRPVNLEIEVPRWVVYRGERIDGAIVATYHYGEPVAGAKVEYWLPDGRHLTGETDAKGRLAFSLDTREFSEDQSITLNARLPEEDVGAARNLYVAVLGLRLSVATQRDVYLAGEQFHVGITAKDPMGKPVATDATLRVLRRVEAEGRWGEVEAEKHALKTDKGGNAGVALALGKGGIHILRLSAVDQFGHTVTTDRQVRISDQDDPTKLLLLTERGGFDVGEMGEVNLYSRLPEALALVTFEGDAIISYRLMPIRPGANPVKIAVGEEHFPNFGLSVAVMQGNQFYTAVRAFSVRQHLVVALKPSKEKFAPGEPVTVDITAEDSLGKPVRAELSLAVVDHALLAQFPDPAPDLAGYFAAGRREARMRTDTSCTFTYAARTMPAVTDVLAEQERLARLEEAKRRRDEVLAQARAAVPRSAPAGEKVPVLGDLAVAGARLALKGPAGPPGPAGAYAPLNALGVARALPAAKPPPPVSPPLRERFPETAYWSASIITDAEGKARVTFPAPDTMTSWELVARGINTGTLAGQASRSITVAKDFFVELRVPPVFMEGDQPRITARVHAADGLKGEAALTLETRFGDKAAAQTRTVQVGGPGAWETVFEAATVPLAEQAMFSLSATLGGASDRIQRTVPIAPWGIEFAAARSGLAADDRTVTLALPTGREYTGLGLRIVLGPSLNRTLVDIALDAVSMPGWRQRCDTRADTASELLGVLSCMEYVKRTAGGGAADWPQLQSRAEALLADLLVSQREDGGWPWAGRGESDRYASSRALWALSLAKERGLPVGAEATNRAAGYLTDQFAKADLADSEGKAALLHALSLEKKAEFEFAHRLYRMRDQMSDGGLALLALTFVNLERKEIAGEVLDTLLARAREEPLDGDTGATWPGKGNQPWLQSDVETTALATLAAERARPESPKIKQAVAWLMSKRHGAGWQPAKAKGPVLAALCGYYAGAEHAAERYRLAVKVNGAEVKALEVTGASPTAVIEVPRGAVRAGENRLDFHLEGRGEYSYAAALTGFSSEFGKGDDLPYRISTRRYEPPAPEYKGRPLQTGFSVARDYQYFYNEVSQLPAGNLARVTLYHYRTGNPPRSAVEDDFLVIEDTLPAGATVVEGSIYGAFLHFTQADGRLIFYARGSRSGEIRYDLYGYAPGEYRVLPTVIRTAYGSEVVAIGAPLGLTVLARGEKSTDKYRATPDELFNLGKALFADGRYDDAQAPLAELYEQWKLNDQPLRETARMLLDIAVERRQPKEVVKYFEVLRERYPEAVLPFDKMLGVAGAYRQVGEEERACLAYRAITDASFLRDAAVPGVLEEQGRFLESIDHMVATWRAYPDTPATESAYYAISQALYEKALKPDELPKLQKGLTKQDVLLRTIGLINRFLTLYPRNPICDEASFSLANAFLELEDYDSVVKLAQRFDALYPESAYRDDFRYIEAVGEFWLGHHQRALEVAQQVAASKTVDEHGVEQESKNKILALYIAAQIYHATREPAKAVEYYRMVADRYPEAKEAADYFEKQSLSLPEVTIAEPGGKAAVTLTYRNLKETDVRVYRVDLMKLYLTRRSLAEAARIDLAGVSPLHQATVALNPDTGARAETKTLELALGEEGAYLVLARSDGMYASGLLLVTPLAVDAQEDAQAGRVRVNVRDTKTGEYASKVHVKVIGSESGQFVSGETDLRGVFIADAIRGQATAIVRGEGDRYAFYRGETWLGPPPEAAQAEAEAAEKRAQQLSRGSYLENVSAVNVGQQAVRSQELRDLYQQGKGYVGAAGGIQAGWAQ